MSGSGEQPNPGDEQSSQQGGQPQDGQPQQGGQPPQGSQPPQGQPQQGGQPPQGQPQQGGQPQQPQGGQPPQGQYQGGYGRPPRGGGESVIDALKRPKPKEYLKGITILGAVGAIMLSFMTILVMTVGSMPFLPEVVDVALQDTSGQVAQVGNDTISMTHGVLVAYLSTELLPFVAFGFAIAIGVFVHSRMEDTNQAKIATAGVGVFAGSFLLVFISSILVGALGPSIPSSLQNASAALSLVGFPNLSGIATGLTSIQFGSIFLNGLVAGIGAGLTAAVTTYSLDEFLPA